MSETTVRGMASMMKQFINFSQIEEIEEFTKLSVMEWIRDGKTERNWSAKTIRIYLCYLGLFSKWCVSEGHLKENPVESIPMPRLEKKLPVCLSEDEAEMLIEWVKNYRYYYRLERVRAVAIFAVFIGTGIRKAELKNLKVNDVDLQECCIHVRSGKGKKDRMVPFHVSLAAVLGDYLKQRDRMKCHCPYFFLSLKIDAPIGDKALTRLFMKIRERSGIHVTPHMLRHTYATIMLQRGLDIREVQELLGHASIESTIIYLSVVVGRLREQVKRHGISF